MKPHIAKNTFLCLAGLVILILSATAAHCQEFQPAFGTRYETEGLSLEGYGTNRGFSLALETKLFSSETENPWGLGMLMSFDYSRYSIPTGTETWKVFTTGLIIWKERGRFVPYAYFGAGIAGVSPYETFYGQREAVSVGGGVDIRLGKHLSIRPVELDFTHARDYGHYTRLTSGLFLTFGKQ